MSANLLYQQTFGGNIKFIGYSANNLEVCNTEIATSNLKTLSTYLLSNPNMLATRSSSTASASTELTLHYTSPVRLIAGAVVTMMVPKDQISISGKPTTCKAVLPSSFDCSYSFDSSDSNYYKFSVT